MSGHVFELHTPVLELGVRGATHALRVLSSKIAAAKLALSVSRSAVSCPFGTAIALLFDRPNAALQFVNQIPTHDFRFTLIMSKCR